MKKIKILTLTILFSNSLYSQDNPKEYYVHTKRADSLFNLKEYIKSSNEYSLAFKSNGWKGFSDDRYKSACSWALSSVNDSAFFQLDRIITKLNYWNYGKIVFDTSLYSLHNDSRWKSTIGQVKLNADNAENHLLNQLDVVHIDDQLDRRKLFEIENKYGKESSEAKHQKEIINKKDSINIKIVTAIIDKYGWLGKDLIGATRNSTLFLVIQHSDIKTQQKYLPKLREAVEKGNAESIHLALLEDRVNLRLNKKQIYGSQIGFDKKSNKYYVLPIENPEQVDERRKQVGLGVLSEYVKQWDIIWDIEQYKKELPYFEEIEKTRIK